MSQKTNTLSNIYEDDTFISLPKVIASLISDYTGIRREWVTYWKNKSMRLVSTRFLLAQYQRPTRNLGRFMIINNSDILRTVGNVVAIHMDLLIELYSKGYVIEYPSFTHVYNSLKRNLMHILSEPSISGMKRSDLYNIAF
jgi:hypothetical protein